MRHNLDEESFFGRKMVVDIGRRHFRDLADFGDRGVGNAVMIDALDRRLDQARAGICSKILENSSFLREMSPFSANAECFGLE